MIYTIRIHTRHIGVSYIGEEEGFTEISSKQESSPSKIRVSYIGEEEGVY